MGQVFTDTTSCGVTLVAPTKVVTAAHCVQSGEMNVALDFTDRDEIAGGAAEVRRVVASEVHPQWVGELDYDVAVLTLASPSTVPPVRIAGPSDGSLWGAGAPGTHRRVGADRRRR